ncbi:MAG: D-tyrosyl-tRNA(Tyr) deacylase [Lachnospiraceae bacterium]|nr:D-tyrosyl-tRNA(Tyr) deacylase [Lachnospiraceae bacterium]
MRFVIQRVNHASVTVNQKTIGSIEKGYLVLIGISQEDTTEIADKMINKMLHLRIFADTDGKTNLSLLDVNGSLLLVSQFTLYANCRKGNRPSFTDAGKPDMAKELYGYLIQKAKQACPSVQSGEFGADMKVLLENDGPFTVFLDSDDICP